MKNYVFAEKILFWNKTIVSTDFSRTTPLFLIFRLFLSFFTCVELSLLFRLSDCVGCLLQNPFSHEFQLFSRKVVAELVV